MYNKAVRDRIPDIIRDSGSTCTVKVLPDEEFLPYLDSKLREELEEYESSRSVVELADLIEVIYRISELRNTPIKALESIRLEKRVERGGFEKNLFLIDTS